MNIKKVISRIVPPLQWRVPVMVALGVLFGLVFVILHVSNATSYMSDNPRACINCHVMTAQYASWSKSSHARVTTCNDCHVPHDNIINTYRFKASDGLRHAYMFTFRLEPQVINLKDAGINVVQQNCIRCHEHHVHRVNLINPVTVSLRETGDGRYCWDCHRETPHGAVKSLSAFPYARVPELPPVIPAWLENFTRRQTAN